MQQGKAGKAAAMSKGDYLYVESIKEGVISVQDAKSGVRVDLFKGLNKLKKSDWEKVKGLPLMKSYLEAETVKESKTRCLDPVHTTPEKVEEVAEAKAKHDKADAERVAEAKAEEAKEVEEAGEEMSESESVEAEEGAE